MEKRMKILLWGGCGLCLLIVLFLSIYLFGGSGDRERPAEDSGIPANVGVSLSALPVEKQPVRTALPPPPSGDDETSAAEPAPAQVNPSPFRVRVSSEEGFPVDNAKVTLYTPMATSGVQADTVTGPAGEAILPFPSPGSEIEVRADGFLPRRLALRDPPYTQPFPVVLARGEVFLEGKVVDDLDRPVSGALVRVAWKDGKSAEASSADDGVFALVCKDLPSFPLEATVRITHSKFCFLGEDIPIVLKKRSGLCFKVHRWARVRVRVVDPEGKPLADARVGLAGPPGAPDRRRLPGMLLGISRTTAADAGAGPDAGGRPAEAAALLEKAPPLCPLWVVVEHPEYAAAETEIGKLEPAEERVITVRLSGRPKARATMFRVVDPAGDPVPEIDPSIAWNYPGGHTQNSVNVSENSSFRILPPAGRWTLLVTAPGFAPLKKDYDTADLGGDTVVLVMVPASAEIEVLVRDVAGRPVAGKGVAINDERLNDPVFWTRSEESGSIGPLISKARKTDAEGRARFSGLDPAAKYEVDLGGGFPGAYDFAGDKAGDGEVPSPASYRDVAPGAPPLLFKLVPPSSLGGLIRGNVPPAKDRLVLWCIDERSAKHRVLFNVSTPVGSDGSFLFVGLPPGRYDLSLSLSDWRPDSGKPPLEEWNLREGENLRDQIVTIP